MSAVVTERSGHVLVARLDRPPLNALDDALVQGIGDALDEALRHDVCVLHVRTNSDVFCGGAHPARLTAWLDPSTGPAAAAADGRCWNALFQRLESVPLVVLAEIRGMALGAGLGLALACDLRIAAEGARFGAPEARFGLLPTGQTTARIGRLAGPQVARRLLLSGATIGAADALSLGLVDWTAPPDRLANRAADIVQRIAGLSPLALREAKAMINNCSMVSTGATEPAGDRSADLEEAALRRLLASPDDRVRLGELLGRL